MSSDAAPESAEAGKRGQDLLSSTDVDLYNYFIGFSNEVLNTFGYKLPYNNKPKKLSEIHNIVGPGCAYDERAMEKLMVPAALDVDGEIPILKINNRKGGQQPRTFPKPQGPDLDTLKSLKWAESNVKEKYYSTQYSEKLWIKSNVKKKSAEFDMTPFGDYLLHIRIHKPFKSEPKVKKSVKLSSQEDILVLSSHKLSVLRDAINCVNDFATTGDKSDDPISFQPVYAKDEFKSAFFFINTTFYNDTRHVTHIDYSKVIREWAAKNPKFPNTNFQVSTMDVCFRDLKLKLGYPYLYKHLGSCEHIITFVNAKLLNKPDDMDSKHYPMRRTPFSYAKNKLCIMCGFFNAVWLTTGNEYVPHDPAFFCHNCFRSFNFVNGKKICDFTSYPLVDRKDLPAKELDDPVLVPPEAVAGSSGNAEVHPLLFAPRNTHREQVVNPESQYPPNAS